MVHDYCYCPDFFPSILHGSFQHQASSSASSIVLVPTFIYYTQYQAIMYHVLYTEQKQIYGHMTENAPIHSASNCIKNALNKCFSRLTRLSEVALKSARNLQKDTYFSSIPNLPPINRILGTDLESCADMHLKKMKVLLPLSLD